MHHPRRLGAFPGAASVVDQGLLQADAVAGGIYRLVDASRLPEAGAGHPVGPYAVPVLSSPQAKEETLLLPGSDGFCKCSKLIRI